MFAFGAIESITPRQMAAAESGPKSVRKEMKGLYMAANGTGRTCRDGVQRGRDAVSEDAASEGRRDLVAAG
jgi:hypothetical protein